MEHHLKLTKNGEEFFINCSVVEFDNDEIQSWGITDKDLQELIDNDYIYFYESTDTYFWRQNETY